MAKMQDNGKKAAKTLISQWHTNSVNVFDRLHTEKKQCIRPTCTLMWMSGCYGSLENAGPDFDGPDSCGSNYVAALLDKL